MNYIFCFKLIQWLILVALLIAPLLVEHIASRRTLNERIVQECTHVVHPSAVAAARNESLKGE